MSDTLENKVRPRLIGEVGLRVLAIALFIVGCLSLMNGSTVGSAEDIGSSGDVASNESDESHHRDKDCMIIAFGCCCHQEFEQPLWDDILSQGPDLWIWLGDNIYGDSEDMSVMRAKYNQNKSNPLYQQLVKSTPVIGTWDDHDYGMGDGGKRFSMKAESQQEHLDFLDVPPDDIRRTREGVYNSYLLSRKSIANVKVILLDTRYFRDDLVVTDDHYGPNLEGEILGEAQWKWLEQELAGSDADIHIIGSSIQVISEEHGLEKWANFPAERKRLLDLLVRFDVKHPILISGDRHIGEMSALRWNGKYFFEVSAGSLTHARKDIDDEINKHRLGSIVNVENYGTIEVSRDDCLKIKVFIKADNRKVMADFELN